MSVLTPVPKATKKPRPYWHVDAKWVSAILFGFVLAVWLLLFAAYQVTQREVAVQLMTRLVTLGIKTGDEAANNQAIDSLRKQIAESPTKSVQPIAGFPATITEADLQLGAEGLRDKIFRQVVEPIYDKGPRKLAEEQTSDKAAQDKFVNDASALSLFTKDSHDLLGTWLVAVGIIGALIGALAVFFSAGLGRFVTPAIALMLVALPGLVLFSLLVASTAQASAPASEAQDYLQLLAAAKGAFAPAASAAQQVYLTAVLTALALLAVALVGKIIYSTIKRPSKQGRV